MIGYAIALVVLLIIVWIMYKKKEGLTDILGNVDNMGYTPFWQGTFRRQKDMLLGMFP